MTWNSFFFSLMKINVSLCDRCNMKIDKTEGGDIFHFKINYIICITCQMPQVDPLDYKWDDCPFTSLVFNMYCGFEKHGGIRFIPLIFLFTDVPPLADSVFLELSGLERDLPLHLHLCCDGF